MANSYLNRTPSGAGNRKTFTISAWIKRSKIGSSQSILNNADGSGLNGTYFEFGSDKLLYFDFGKIGRAHVRTPVTSQSRMPSSA